MKWNIRRVSFKGIIHPIRISCTITVLCYWNSSKFPHLSDITVNNPFARREVKFEKDVVIFSSNNCQIAEIQAITDSCPIGIVCMYCKGDGLRKYTVQVSNKRMKAYYFCDGTKNYSRDIYENARQDCDVSFGHLTVTLYHFQIVTPNDEQRKIFMDAKEKTLLWTDYKLINRTTFYSKTWLHNCFFDQYTKLWLLTLKK